MDFMRIGEFLAVSRITGPRHNMLQLKLGAGPQGMPICEALPPQGGCIHEPLDEAKVVAFVLEGVADANLKFGSQHSVTNIRYVKNDTRPEVVYGFLAHEIVKHLQSKGEFRQGSGNAL